MKITTFLQQYTGLGSNDLFGGNPPMVSIASDASGEVTFPVWSVPNIVRPTPDEITTALAAQEPTFPYQLVNAANAKANALLSASRGYAFSGGSILADAMSTTIADIAAMQAVSSQPWVDNANDVSTVTGAQMATVLPLVTAYRASVFAALATVLTGIKHADPTLATVAQIEAYAWPA